MAAELLVEPRIDDGQKLLTQLARDGFNVTVAFWVTTSEEGLRFFYIGSTSVDPAKIGDAYRAVYASLLQIPESSISLSEIKLVAASNPLAVAAKSIRDHRAGGAATRFLGERLADLAVDDVYIYPSSAGEKPVNLTLYGLYFKGLPGGSPLSLAFEPYLGKFGLRVNEQEYQADTSLSWRVSAPAGARLEKGSDGTLELVWDFNGREHRSDPNEVNALAELGLHGFALIESEETKSRGTAQPPTDE